MPYSLMNVDDLNRLGSEQSDSNEEVDGDTALIAGLDAMEEDGYSLVHVIEPYVTMETQGWPKMRSDLRFLFHKPKTTRARILSD